MSKAGIDVSSYNGAIDWSKVKADGYDFAVLKIIRKDLNKDKLYDRNLIECRKAGIEVLGVYNYSYATTVAKAKLDAESVVHYLDGEKIPVWLDVEDACQKGLGQKLINIILAYKSIIEESGNKFGVYTGQSFYNSYLKPYYIHISDIPMWIARYGLNNGKKDVKYQPQINNLVAWQYTSKGKVQGINGYVDLNVCYDDQFVVSDKSVFQFTVADKPVAKYKEPTRLLKYKILNMRGEDVKWVQQCLVSKSCLPAINSKGKYNIDGVFGKDTRDAVIRFQKNSKIEVDGIVGQETRKYLKK